MNEQQTLMQDEPQPNQQEVTTVSAPEQSSQEVATDTRSPEERFQAFLQEYGTLTGFTLEYVLDKKHDDLAAAQPDGNPFMAMDPAEAAALLIAVDANDQTPPPAENQITTAQSTSDELRARVIADQVAGELYNTERVQHLDTEQLIQEAVAIERMILLGEAVSPTYLHLVLETIEQRGQEVEVFLENHPEEKSAIESLKSWTEREQKLADIAVATEAALESSEVEQAVPENATIDDLKRTDEGLVVTMSEPGTADKKQIVVKEKDIWSLVFITVMSDALLGTQNINYLVEGFAKKNISGPLLLRMGVNLRELGDIFAANEYDAMDGMLKAMDSRTCNKYFEDATDKGYLFTILKQCRPEHLEKIFAPKGTESFGSTTFLDADHITLEKELVSKMYTSLTESQRNELKIPQQVTP